MDGPSQMSGEMCHKLLGKVLSFQVVTCHFEPKLETFKLIIVFLERGHFFGHFFSIFFFKLNNCLAISSNSSHLELFQAIASHVKPFGVVWSHLEPFGARLGNLYKYISFFSLLFSFPYFAFLCCFVIFFVLLFFSSSPFWHLVGLFWNSLTLLEPFGTISSYLELFGALCEQFGAI